MTDEQNTPVVIRTSLNDYRDAITKLHAEALAMKGAMVESSAIMTITLMPGTHVLLVVGKGDHYEKIIDCPLDRALAGGKVRIGFFLIPER